MEHQPTHPRNQTTRSTQCQRRWQHGVGQRTEIYFPEFENTLLICVTETKNKYQLDKYIQTMKDALKEV